MFQHPVFKSPLFAVFAQQVKDMCAQQQGNEDKWLQAEQANEFLTRAVRDLIGQQAYLLKEFQQGRKLSSEDFESMRAYIKDLANQTIHITVSRGESAAEAAHAYTCFTSDIPGQRPTSCPGEANVGTKRKQQVPDTVMATVQDVPDLPAKKQKVVLNGGIVAVPQHDIPDNLSSVEDLRRVWREGTPFMPAVAVLEEKYGARWRPPARRMYFSIRKSIMDEVQLRAETHGWDEKVAAADMDRERGKRSLANYQKYLKGRK
ncbi:hypothetical protein F5883DRAFT_594352 [Diaporthe sp. PMI_573]|nr:hypothetical protein F5883DRAFT_594352 [Diaporthaceae sp. PMI_573]